MLTQNFLNQKKISLFCSKDTLLLYKSVRRRLSKTFGETLFSRLLLKINILRFLFFYDHLFYNNFVRRFFYGRPCLKARRFYNQDMIIDNQSLCFFKTKYIRVATL